MQVGRLEKINVRELWEKEASDFTPWLVEPENIEILADEIGIGIVEAEAEASAGRFRVDILAKEETTGRIIIIENQLGRTDHTHLGQLITYAAALDAKFVIWIVSGALEEHRQAVDWLNENTGEETLFFLVALELWRINGSPPAPKFNVVSRPNEWTKTVRSSAHEGLTETRQRQGEFWERFYDYASNSTPQLRLPQPKPGCYYNIRLGLSGTYISLAANSQRNIVRCELYISDSQELYRALYANREAIENELDLPEAVEWMELPEKIASSVHVTTEFDFMDDSTWDDAIAWLADRAARFCAVFSRDWPYDPSIDEANELYEREDA